MSIVDKKDGKHLFALFVHNLSDIITSKKCYVVDLALIHRVVHIIRLQVDDELILFDREQHATVRINVITKKNIEASVQILEKNVVLKPTIRLFLPVLKKDALSEAIYSAVEVGASEIQLIYTEKSQKSLSDHELDRLERVAISAAEQSKQFAFPEIKKPVNIESMAGLLGSVGIFFDPAGIPMAECIDTCFGNTEAEIYVLIGPEGDLTEIEKNLLKKSQWTFCALTPTILRSMQAVAVGLGVLRSMLR